MLAWIVLAATTPALLCLGASAFLAYRDKAQWSSPPFPSADWRLPANDRRVAAGRAGVGRVCQPKKNTPPSSTG